MKRLQGRVHLVGGWRELNMRHATSRRTASKFANLQQIHPDPLRIDRLGPLLERKGIRLSHKKLYRLYRKKRQSWLGFSAVDRRPAGLKLLHR